VKILRLSSDLVSCRFGFICRLLSVFSTVVITADGRDGHRSDRNPHLSVAAAARATADSKTAPARRCCSRRASMPATTDDHRSSIVGSRMLVNGLGIRRLLCSSWTSSAHPSRISITRSVLPVAALSDPLGGSDSTDTFIPIIPVALLLSSSHVEVVYVVSDDANLPSR